MSGRGEAGVLPSISFGVVSAFVGQLVAFPLETISRRMQVLFFSSSVQEAPASLSFASARTFTITCASTACNDSSIAKTKSGMQVRPAKLLLWPHGQSQTGSQQHLNDASACAPSFWLLKLLLAM